METETFSASQIGQTGRQRSALETIPRLGLGTAPIGNLYQDVPESQAIETVHTALEKGITFFDTAPLYGTGLSEARLGQALIGVPHDRYAIATKIGYCYQADKTQFFDYSRAGIWRSLEASLTRLKTDRVDILHIHESNQNYAHHLAEAFPTMMDLKQQGVVKAIGVGVNWWEVVANFEHHDELDCVLLAGRYTLLEQAALPYLNRCEAAGVKVFLAGVYNSGILATGAITGAKYNYRDAPPEIVTRAAQVEAICQRHQVSMTAAALQVSRTHPAVAALIVGACHPDEIRANIASWQATIPADLWADLQQEGLLAADVPIPQT